MTYYTLIIRRSAGAAFEIDFGDYDRESVNDEMRGYIESGEHKPADLKIVRSKDDQASIETAVAAYNRKV